MPSPRPRGRPAWSCREGGLLDRAAERERDRSGQRGKSRAVHRSGHLLMLGQRLRAEVDLDPGDGPGVGEDGREMLSVPHLRMSRTGFGTAQGIHLSQSASNPSAIYYCF